MSFLRVIITLNLATRQNAVCRIAGWEVELGKRSSMVPLVLLLCLTRRCVRVHLTVWDEVSDWQAERGYVVLASELSTLIKCFLK